MTTCASCSESTDDPVAVRGLLDAPGIVEVCRDCLPDVLARMRLRPVPTLREELDAIFDDDAP